MSFQVRQAEHVLLGQRPAGLTQGLPDGCIQASVGNGEPGPWPPSWSAPTARGFGIEFAYLGWSFHVSMVRFVSLAIKEHALTPLIFRKIFTFVCGPLSDVSNGR